MKDQTRLQKLLKHDIAIRGHFEAIALEAILKRILQKVTEKGDFEGM